MVFYVPYEAIAGVLGRHEFIRVLTRHNNQVDVLRGETRTAAGELYVYGYGYGRVEGYS